MIDFVVFAWQTTYRSIGMASWPVVRFGNSHCIFSFCLAIMPVWTLLHEWARFAGVELLTVLKANMQHVICHKDVKVDLLIE